MTYFNLSLFWRSPMSCLSAPYLILQITLSCGLALAKISYVKVMVRCCVDMEFFCLLCKFFLPFPGMKLTSFRLDYFRLIKKNPASRCSQKWRSFPNEVSERCFMLGVLVIINGDGHHHRLICSFAWSVVAICMVFQKPSSVDFQRRNWIPHLNSQPCCRISAKVLKHFW